VCFARRSECGVYANKNCLCFVSVSNFFSLFVGLAELVAAIVITFAKSWLKEYIGKIQSRTRLCDFNCPVGLVCGPDAEPADPFPSAQCKNPAFCSPEFECQVDSVCKRICDRDQPETLICCDDDTFDGWLSIAKWCLWCLAFAQVLRFCCSQIFRSAL
jgi:hypothetical protein